MGILLAIALGCWEFAADVGGPRGVYTVLCRAILMCAVVWPREARPGGEGKGGDVMLRQMGTIGFLGRPLLQEKKVIITSIECFS
jgi:hypothetical protein